LVFVLVAAGAIAVAASDEPIVAPEKPDLALAVTFVVPKEEKLARVKELFDKVKAQGATHLKMRVPPDAEALSAEIVAQPQTPSKRVAAVVRELLDCGIKKISVEVTKSENGARP
jgi:hypothetical protein